MRTIIFFGSASIGLFVIVLLTFLFGRVYCSTICPLGVLQDIIIRVSKKINRRRSFRFKRPSYVIHYTIFIVSTVLALCGSVVLLNLLEPFTNYGRIISNLINPALISVKNIFVNIFGFLWFSNTPILNLNMISMIASVLFLLLIVYMSYFHGRLFCNLLCPAGAFLGLISRFTVFKIVIDHSNCKECGLCERVCKADCIDSDSKKIEFAACIGCFNCLSGCPTKGMSFKSRWNKKSIYAVKVDIDRRKVLLTSVAPIIGLLSAGKRHRNSNGSNNSGYEENKHIPITPPGSAGVKKYSNLCTACHLCVSSCPTQVLVPSVFEYGLAGLFQPKMDYDKSYCNYDCVLCGQVCPTGAILPLTPENKKLTQIGRAVFNKNDCVVVRNQTDCGACSEHCPTKAVDMVPYGELVIPQVNDIYCIGCGACEHVCPASPDKAIYVIANNIHLTAQKPESKKIEPSFDSDQDFPF
jgi:ferredoxin